MTYTVIEKAIRNGNYRIEKGWRGYYTEYAVVSTKYGDTEISKRELRDALEKIGNEEWFARTGYNTNVEHTAFMNDIMDAYNDSLLQYAM